MPRIQLHHTRCILVQLRSYMKKTFPVYNFTQLASRGARDPFLKAHFKSETGE